jgi:hypothetical protein
MDILRGFNVPVPKGGVATSVDEAQKVYVDKIGQGKYFIAFAFVCSIYSV